MVRETSPLPCYSPNSPQQQWTRNVEAREFVVTLQDNFNEIMWRSSARPPSEENTSTARPSYDAEEWAREYISVKHLQSIIDAIDDDGSGHITIAEINRFTELKPIQLKWR